MGASQPLSGVRVVEVGGGVASGFAGRLLAGFGADVVVVARPRLPPLTSDEEVYLRAGKRTVDVTPDELVDLLGRADIVVDETGTIGPDIRAPRPELVVVSVTPFGRDGPYHDYRTTNAVSFAMGGIMWLTGEPDVPLVTGGSQAYYLAGLTAFAAAVSALYRRRRTGRGDHVDTSMQEIAASMLELFGPMVSYDGLVQPRTGNRMRAAWAVYPCLDGHAGPFCLERQIHTLLDLIRDTEGVPELDEDRFRDPLQRPDHDDELTAHVFPFFATRTKAELLDIGRSHRIPIGVALTPEDLLASTGLAERGVFDEMETPHGSVRVPGRPFAGFGWRALGEVQQATAADVACAWDGPPSNGPGRQPSGEPGAPLAGIRVLDLTMMWAGPFATQKLAELGADVIKIESPRAWDNIRTLLPQDPAITDPWNSAFYFEAYNKSKRSLTLDLAEPAGREVFLRLVATADVVIENYRADVLDKLGLGYEVLREARDDIVLVSMAAFGKSGPDADLVGFGPVIELMSGLASLTGWGDGEPVKTGISYGDPLGGTGAVAAVALALLERDRTGGGRWVDMAQRELGTALAGEAFAAASLRGEPPVHHGNRDPRFVPQGAYRCHDGFVVISVTGDAEWDALAAILLRTDLAGLGAADRRRRHDELDAAIGEWTAQRAAQTVMERLQAAGVAAGRVHDGASLLTDPHLGTRCFWEEIPHPRMHPFRQPAATWHFAEAPTGHRRHAPLFGEHNREILVEELGLTSEEMADLHRRGVVADAPIDPGVG